MTRILRLLLIAAIALPYFGNAAAQDVQNFDTSRLLKTDSKNLEVVNLEESPSAAANGSHLMAPSPKVNEVITASKLVCEGAQTNQYVPIYGPGLNATSYRPWGQMIYPSSTLGLSNGVEILSITFCANGTIGVSSGTTNSVTLRIGETTATTINSTNAASTNRNNMTAVYTGMFPTGSDLVKFEFSSPYVYNGGNLMLDLICTTGNMKTTSVSWYGVSATNGSSYYYNNDSWFGANSGRASFLPEMIVEYRTQKNIDARDIVVKDSNFFEGISYDWTDDNGVSHNSDLGETATDPDQIIAMLREVYVNKTIPGNLKRGFWYDGSNEEYNDVDYAAVGIVGGQGSVTDASTYQYIDAYGWDIPTEKPLSFNSINSSNLGTSYYTYLDPTEFRPNEEGLTLLLVEMVDDFNKDQTIAGAEDKSGYELLRYLVGNTIKSVKIVSEARRVGEGLESGTLFKIDCDKMNKFFLLAKGQLRWAFNSFLAERSNGNPFYQTFCPYPAYLFNSSTGINGYVDELSTWFLFHMFEQFSPVTPDASQGRDDIYQDLINMESFGVEHDCVSIAPIMDHQFMMYGEDSDAADCQDVRDMMFFIPDYRMLKDADRDNGYSDGSLYWQKFLNYNKDHQPIMGLYVIRQNEITPTTAANDYYMLNLNWVTNLDDFLPSQDQEFELLQVVVNEETGLEEYVPVYYMNANGEYTDADGHVVTTPVAIVLHLGPGAEKNYPDVYVERQTYSQQVTYAIRGRDAGHFLSLQISNRQSYIIPGTDPTELVSLIELAHYSRYNPENEENCYSNRFKLSNNVGGVRRADITSAQNNTTVFTFTRKTSATDENPVTIATATVTNKTSGNSGVITVKMQNQAAETEFPRAKNGSGYAGYHANPENGEWEHTFTYNTGSDNVQYVNFGDLVLCDNFIEDVSANAHPNQYIYEVHFNIATANQGSHDFTEAHGSAFRVPIYKTASKVNNAFSLIEVKGDKDHAIPMDDLTFSERVQYSSKTEILRYDVYRWLAGETRYIVSEVGANDAEQDLAPDGIAGNQGEGYTVTMNDVNGDYYYNGGTVAVSSGTAWANFVDYYPASVAESNAEGKAYIYAPVVETFTVGKNVIGDARTDYNTYGGPQQKAAVGVLDIDNPVYEISGHSWLKGNDRYAYYTVELPIKTDAVPNGYKVYMVRAWRVVDPSLLDEPLEQFASRKTETGEYLFEEMLGPNEEDGEYQPGQHMSLGGSEIPDVQDLSGNDVPVWRGTFGARKVRTQTGDNDGVIESLPMTFRVRLYFTPETTSKAGEQDKAFYVAEYTTDFTINGGIPTGIVDVMNAKQIVSEKFYNPAGIESDTPFKGVNIVVTRYSDGSTSTVKVLK